MAKGEFALPNSVLFSGSLTTTSCSKNVPLPHNRVLGVGRQSFCHHPPAFDFLLLAALLAAVAIMLEKGTALRLGCSSTSQA
jgi:hypothetical protein